jgi:hypothetical protein
VSETSITVTTIGPSTENLAIVPVAGRGTSSLALAAAAAQNDPPIAHEPVEIDVDKELYGDDDYMPPPEKSGDKRSRTNVTSIIPTVPDP